MKFSDMKRRLRNALKTHSKDSSGDVLRISTNIGPHEVDSGRSWDVRSECQMWRPQDGQGGCLEDILGMFEGDIPRRLGD